MDKIFINLNPKKKIEKNRLDNLLAYTEILKIITFILLIIILLLGIFTFLNYRIYSNYQKKWINLEPKFNTLKEVKKEISILENESRELQRITTPMLFIPIILEELFISLPDNIWFDNLVYKKDLLNIKGYVLKWKEDQLVSLDRFISNLKKKGYFYTNFKKINIKDFKKVDFFGIDVLEFYLECTK